MNKVNPATLIENIDVDKWTVGDAVDLVEIAGLGFDEALKLLVAVASGESNYGLITPGLLAAVLTIEGRRSGFTAEDVRDINLVECLKELSKLAR